jgi:hypothetical protein
VRKKGRRLSKKISKDGSGGRRQRKDGGIRRVEIVEEGRGRVGGGMR